MAEGEAPNSAPPSQLAVTGEGTRLQHPRLQRKGGWEKHRAKEKENQKKIYQNFNPNLKAKNKWQELKILYYNCRGLANDDRLYLFEREVEKIRWDIIGISEVRRMGEKLLERKTGNYFYYYGTTKGYRGIGFYISKKLKDRVVQIRGISERIGLLKLKLDDRTKIVILQVYAPTASADEEENEKFYLELENTLRDNKEYYVVIMGDFNAKIGGEEGPKVIGRYGLGKRNEKGEKLMDFASKYGFKIANTFFRKKEKRKWTWMAPDGKTKNEIDHLLINDRSIVKNISILSHFNFPSDHRIARCELRIPKRAQYTNYSKKKAGGKWVIPISKRQEAEGKLKEILKTTNTGSNPYNILVQGLKDVTREFGVKRKEEKTCDKLSKETLDLIRRKNNLWRKKNKKLKEKIELTEIQKVVKRRVRQDLRKAEESKIQEILEENWSIKKVKKELSAGKNIIMKMKDQEGRISYNQEEIIEIVTKFYENLYQRRGGPLQEQGWKRKEEEETPKILKSEVAYVIKRLKNNKTPGPDEIENELLKGFGDILTPHLTKIFNEILTSKVIPEQWNLAEIILVYKKGDKENVENYRPISLTSNICKVFMAILKNRMYNKLDFNQGIEQAGFRKGFSTVDNIFVLNQIIEKTNEFNLGIKMLSIDFHKAFDSVDHEYLKMSLRKQGLEEDYIHIIQNYYKNAKARITLKNRGREFKVEKGVRQGDPLSPNLFNCILEEIFHNLKWANKGLKINGEYLNNLRYADDIIIFAKNITELEEMANELITECKKAGLKINGKKTKIIGRGEKQNLIIDDQDIEEVEEIEYLGQTISFKDRSNKIIKQRIKKGWNNFWALKTIFKGKISLKAKIKILRSSTVPALTYGAQTWSLTKIQLEKMNTTYRSMLRKLMGLKWDTKTTNENLMKMVQGKNLAYTIKKLKWNYAGHLAREKKDRWAVKILNWMPSKDTRRKGRPATRWRDELVNECKWQKEQGKPEMHWQHKARDKRKWKADGEAYAQRWAGMGRSNDVVAPTNAV